MNYEVAASSMRLLANIGRKGFLDGLGVSRADFDRFVGDEPWLATDRNRMTSVLNTMINASVDAMGLPRFDLPAEYIAAGIALFVAPVNVHGCCVFAARGAKPTEEMGRGTQSSTEAVSPDRLFALVIQLFSDQRTSARALFEKNTSIALEKMMGKETRHQRQPE